MTTTLVVGFPSRQLRRQRDEGRRTSESRRLTAVLVAPDGHPVYEVRLLKMLRSRLIRLWAMVRSPPWQPLLAPNWTVCRTGPAARLRHSLAIIG